MKLLVVEDNEKLSDYIKKYLEQRKYIVDTIYDGQSAYSMLKNHNYDLVILDLMIPKINGIKLTKTLRKENNMVPIIMLTSLSQLEDRLEGFQSGADDFLTKPFSLEELELRIKAILRRPTNIKSDKLLIKDITLNLTKSKVYKNGKEIQLSAKEFIVLEYLIVNKGIILSRKQILNHCWDFAFEGFSNIVDVYIKRLRKKLHNENYIKTVRGMGYCFEER